MKKLLALVLALVMTLSLATVSSNAAFKDADKVNETYAEAVEVLNGLKVFQGYEDGSFNPTGDITRAEVATIVYRIYTTDVKDTYVKNYETYNKFSDMNGAGWAKGYIGYCANAEFVKGYPDGTFQPSGKVTGYEVLAMILRAVGYDKNNEFSGSDWALHVAQIAERAGILKNVKGVDLNKAATRELVAELLFEAIQTPMVTYTAAFGYQSVSLSAKDNKNLVDNKTLANAFNLNCYEGYVTASFTSKKVYDGMILTDVMDVKDKNDDVTVPVSDQDIFDAGRYGHVWTVKTTAITDVFYDDTLLATSYDGTKISASGTEKTLTYKSSSNSKYVGTPVDDCKYILNGTDGTKNAANNGIVKGTEVAMYSLDGKTVSSFIIVNPTVDVMTADYVVKGDNVKIQGKTFDKDDVSGYEDLASGDVFTYVDMADGVRYFEELTPIDGQKTKYTEPKSGAAYITFGGKDYEKSGLTNTTSSDTANLFSTTKTTFDVDAVIYLDRGGYVAYSAFPASATKYAMVIDSYKVLNDKHTGYDYYANLLLTDGTETGYVAVNNAKSDLTIGYVASDNKKTPSTVGDYDNLGTLVKYSVKDDVYTLTAVENKLTKKGYDESATEASSDVVASNFYGLSKDYVAGGATLNVVEATVQTNSEHDSNEEFKFAETATKYAVTNDTAMFYYWLEETAKDTYKAHYGVNVGKYSATNTDGIPSYEKTTIAYKEKDDGWNGVKFYDYELTGTVVETLCGDGYIEAGVINSDAMHARDKFAYIFGYKQVATTGTTLDAYTYYGVDGEGNVVEFTAYKDVTAGGKNGAELEGHVVWYYTFEDGMSEFGEYDKNVENTKTVNTYSIEKVGNGTYEFRKEGESSEATTYTNASNIFDVTTISKSDEKAYEYNFGWNKQVQALVLWTENPETNDEAEIVCAYVLKDNLTYGEIKISCTNLSADGTYWKPVKNRNEDVYYSLEELDSSTWSGNSYHIGTSEDVKTVTDKEFTADTYTLTKHVAMTYNVKANDGITGASSAVEGANGNYTITIPYTTSFEGKTSGSELVNVVDYMTGNFAITNRMITTKGELTATSDNVVVEVVLKSTDEKCTETFNVTFVKKAPVYEVGVAVDYTDSSDSTITATVTSESDLAYAITNHGGKLQLKKSNDGTNWSNVGSVVTKTDGNTDIEDNESIASHYKLVLTVGEKTYETDSFSGTASASKTTYTLKLVEN